MSVTGGCLCGAVRYELSGPQLFGGFCYCRDCRKISGSHAASMAVPEASLAITGETRSYQGTGGSGNPVFRVFCPTCGSSLYSKGAQPGVVMLKAGSLDDPEQFKPMASIYVSRAPSWDKAREGLPEFEEMPSR